LRHDEWDLVFFYLKLIHYIALLMAAITVKEGDRIP